MRTRGEREDRPVDDSQRQDVRLEQFAAAANAFLEFEARGRPDAIEEFLESHPHLRDLLESMFVSMRGTDRAD